MVRVYTTGIDVPNGTSVLKMPFLKLGDTVELLQVSTENNVTLTVKGIDNLIFTHEEGGIRKDGIVVGGDLVIKRNEISAISPNDLKVVGSVELGITNANASNVQVSVLVVVS